MSATHVSSVPNAGNRGAASLTNAGAADAVDLAVVAHHEEPEARLWLGGRQPPAPSAALSLFSVAHHPAEDAADDR